MTRTADPSIEAIIAAVTGRPLAMMNVARTLLLPKGLIERANEVCEAAIALAPDDPELFAHASGIRSYGVGDWYYTMVQDQPRHELYASAFREIFFPGCVVLDIGAGTGLFAMLAAREGAGRVIACERDPVVAASARRIVEANGLTDRVTILTKDSKDLQVGVDFPEKADILLWDNLANNLLGVGAAETVEDAKRRLIKPGAPIIPQRAEIRVALVDDANAQDRLMGTADGLDLTPFNHLAATNFTLKPARFPRRSSAATIFDIDFRAQAPIIGDRAQVVVEANGGHVHGVAQWLVFHLSDTITYDTSDKSCTAFGTQFH